MQGDKRGEDSSQAETSHSNSAYCVNVRSLLWLIMPMIISIHIQAGTCVPTHIFVTSIAPVIIIFVWFWIFNLLKGNYVHLQNSYAIPIA